MIIMEIEQIHMRDRSQILLMSTLLFPWDENNPWEFTPELTRFHCVGRWNLDDQHTTDTLWHPCIHFFTYSGDRPSEPAVWFMSRVESGRDRAQEDISGPTSHFQQFWNGYICKNYLQNNNTEKCTSKSLKASSIWIQMSVLKYQLPLLA